MIVLVLLAYLSLRMQKNDKSSGARAISSSIIAGGLGREIWLEALCETCNAASTIRHMQKDTR